MKDQVDKASKWMKISTVLVFSALVLPAVTGCKSCEGGACAISASETGKTLSLNNKCGKGGSESLAGCKVEGAAKNTVTVSTEALKTLLDAKTPLVLADARTGQYDDGRRIPGAIELSPTASAEEVAAALPAKDALIVTYCSNVKCQASPKLAAALKKLGYSNILEYSAGIAGWTEAGFEVKETGK